MPESLMFVQFPHPGSEHKPKGSWTDWNRGDHTRKFLKASGSYVSDGKVVAGPFVFWGEWEPQSQVLETLPVRDPGHPRWLHQPVWHLPRHRRVLRNTDPLVFGDPFLYSNCRQQGNRKLRELAPGSLVVFGSKLQGEFVVDTVFVVGDEAEDFTRASASDIPCEDWVRAVVLDPLRINSEPPNERFRLYRGKSYQEASDGLFSFVPCRPYADGGAGFPRPALRLHRRWLNPNLAMGAKATPATPAELRELWDRIVEQVADRPRLALGVKLDAPPHSDLDLS